MREREGERDAVYELNYHRYSEAVGLIPLETMMLPAPCWKR